MVRQPYWRTEMKMPLLSKRLVMQSLRKPARCNLYEQKVKAARCANHPAGTLNALLSKKTGLSSQKAQVRVKRAGCEKARPA
jgi:hypothetical protein